MTTKQCAHFQRDLSRQSIKCKKQILKQLQVLENHKAVYDINNITGKKSKQQSKYKTSIAIIKNSKELTSERQLLVKAQTLHAVNLKQ